jgi:hypothetical protein
MFGAPHTLKHTDDGKSRVQHNLCEVDGVSKTDEVIADPSLHSPAAIRKSNYTARNLAQKHFERCPTSND